MFGLNEITWKLFTQFIISGLLTWYSVLIVFLWLKGKNKAKYLYEEHASTQEVESGINPIQVSSKDLPSQLVSAVSENSIRLEVSVYEEIWPDDGYHINYFLDENTGKLVKILPEIHSQH
nr:hypothetical protein [uncultured Draconibacterium sp.]